MSGADDAETGIVTESAWQQARAEQLRSEKDATRVLDRVAAQR